MRVTAYEIAAAVLSGQPVPREEITPIDPTRLELKMCEWCPRTFMRAIGSTQRHCDACNPGAPATKFTGDCLRTFEVRGKRSSNPYRRHRAAVRRERMLDRGLLRLPIRRRITA